METEKDIHETDTETDDDEDEDEGDDENEDEGNLYTPEAGDSLDEVLQRRISLQNNLHNTNLSTQQGWLKSWTIFMSIRELLEVANLIKSTMYRKLKPASFVKSVDGLRFFDAFVGTTVVGRVISGRGCFFLLQYDSSLSRDCLYQRTTKDADLNLAGTHGCGMKESALCLLRQNAELRMWMPARAVDSSFPGESWTWKQTPEGIMKVKGYMSKTYKARAFLTVVRNLSSSFTFDPRKFLFFKSSVELMHIIPTPIKQFEGVLDYQILVGSSGVYNYGIFVEESELTKKLGFGLNGRYKLADRYRTRTDDVKGRLAAAIKVAVRKEPEKITPYLVRYAKTDSLEWLFPEVPRAEDSEINHNFRNLKSLLIYGLSKMPGYEAQRILLTGPEWTPGEQAIAVSLGYVVFEIADSIHRYEKKVLRPALKSLKIAVSTTSAVAVQDYFVHSCGLTQYTFWEFSINGLIDESAIQPFYVSENDVILSLVGPEGASLKGSYKEVCMGLISKLTSNGGSVLLESIFDTLGKGGHNLPLTAGMEGNNAVGEKRARHGELLSFSKRSVHGDDVSRKLLAEVTKELTDWSKSVNERMKKLN
jgi:hypothetical protein